MSKGVVSKTQEVKVIDQQFKCLARPAHELATLIRENVGGTTVSPFDLDRVKIPSGEAISWAVPGLRGEESVKEIQGIIISFKDTRGYWKGKFTGGNAPPQCISDDGQTGRGDPGGKCEVCPLAQFGSDDEERGQACKATRLLFLMREADIIPLVLALSPMSIGPSRKYFLRLTSGGYPYYSCVTGISLEPAKNKGGITYAKAVFRMIRLLTDEELQKVQAVGLALRDVFTKHTIVQADVSGADGR